MKKIIKIFIIILIIILLISLIDVYFVGQKIFFGKTLSKIIPYPAVFMGRDLISVNEYNKISDTYKKYIFKNENVRSEFINDFFIRYEVIKQASKKFDVTIEKKEYSEFVNNFYPVNETNLVNVYDKNFQEYIIKADFLERKISQRLQGDDFNKDNKKKLESIYADLLENPNLFDDYANFYKDENIAFDNGILGWLPIQDLPDNIQEKVDNMKIDDFTPVMKSISGFHIYKLVGFVENEQGIKYYQISQIFLPKMSFNNYYKDFINTNKIRFLLKIN